VFDDSVFHTKVVSNEAELDVPPLVAPEARHGGSV
jgi:hypothetical protein